MEIQHVCLATIRTLFWAHKVSLSFLAPGLSFRFCNESGDLPHAGLHPETIHVFVFPHRSSEFFRISGNKSLVFHGKGMTDLDGNIVPWCEPRFRHTSLELTAAEIFYLAIQSLSSYRGDRGKLLLALVRGYEQEIGSLLKIRPNGTAQGETIHNTTTIDPAATRPDAPAFSCFTEPLFNNKASPALVLRLETCVLSVIFAFGRLGDLPLQELAAGTASHILVVITPDSMENVPQPQPPNTIWFCTDGAYNINGVERSLMASTAIEVFFHLLRTAKQISSYSQAKLLRILLVQYERALTEKGRTNPEDKVIHFNFMVKPHEMGMDEAGRMTLREFWDYVIRP